MGAKIVSLEMPFQKYTGNLFCPACGEVVYDSEGMPGSCGHVLFTYHDDFGFESEEDTLTKTIEEVLEKAKSCDEHPVKLLSEKITSKSALIFEITHGGMACGPVWDTFYVGIDFYPSVKQGE